MWLWKLFMFLQIHPIRQKRQEKQEWKKGHEKQERYEIQDKKGKYLNIREVTDVIVWYCFQVTTIWKQNYFFLTLKLQGAGVITLLTIMNAIKFNALRYDKGHPLTLFALGRLRIKHRFADSRFLSTRHKHCQRHNGPEGWVHLAKVILQVQTQILIEFHLQNLDSASTKHQHLH